MLSPCFMLGSRLLESLLKPLFGVLDVFEACVQTEPSFVGEGTGDRQGVGPRGQDVLADDSEQFALDRVDGLSGSTELFGAGQHRVVDRPPVLGQAIERLREGARVLSGQLLGLDGVLGQGLHGLGLLPAPNHVPYGAHRVVPVDEHLRKSPVQGGLRGGWEGSEQGRGPFPACQPVPVSNRCDDGGPYEFSKVPIKRRVLRGTRL